MQFPESVRSRSEETLCLRNGSRGVWPVRSTQQCSFSLELSVVTYLRNVLFCLLNCLGKTKQKKDVSGPAGQGGTNYWAAQGLGLGFVEAVI